MNATKKSVPVPVMIILALTVLAMPFLPLLISWRWGWWEAWVYAAAAILGFLASRGLAARKNPDIIAERANSMQNEQAQGWDRVLAPLVAYGSGLVLPVVAGLDARFHWSAGFSLSVEIIGLVLILGGYVLGSYALIANRFFSGTVRIQEERGHTVISRGPYRWVRHPGYAGALLANIGFPLFLSSAWTFLPMLLITVVIVVRTSLEDRFLQRELAGYCEYVEKVRYRLVPWVW
jgi:protein-S-isoprenylcysteine O-methyltransferase Ste14